MISDPKPEGVVRNGAKNDGFVIVLYEESTWVPDERRPGKKRPSTTRLLEVPLPKEPRVHATYSIGTYTFSGIGTGLQFAPLDMAFVWPDRDSAERYMRRLQRNFGLHRNAMVVETADAREWEREHHVWRVRRKANKVAPRRTSKSKVEP